MQRTIALPLLAALLGACADAASPAPDAGAPTDAGAGTDPDADPLARGGTRLRLRTATAEGGARLVLGVHDAERGVDCVPGVGSDGVLRCLPPTGVVFADDRCTVTAVLATCGAPPPFAALAAPRRPCEAPRVSVHQAGPPLAEQPEQVWVRGPGGECQPIGPPGTSVRVHAAPEVDPAGFAALDEVEEAAGPLAVTAVRSADGLAMVTGTAIAATGHACMVRTPGRNAVEPGEPVACVPTVDGFVLPSSATFADAACTQPAAALLPGAGCGDVSPVFHTFERSMDLCAGPTVTYTAAGPRLSAVFQGSAGACGPSADPRAFHALGAAIDPSTFPRLERVSRGAGPVTATRFASDGREVDALPSLEVGGDACTPREFADGITRCLPSSLPRLYRADLASFADPACSRRVVADLPRCGDGPRYVVEFAPACAPDGTPSAVFEAGPVVPGDALFTIGDEGCVPAPPRPGERFVEVGAAAANDVFPRLTVALE